MLSLLYKENKKSITWHPTFTITLIISDSNEKSNRVLGFKLHQQFAHPAAEKLIRLIRNARSAWYNNYHLKRKIKSNSENFFNMQSLI